MIVTTPPSALVEVVLDVTVDVGDEEIDGGLVVDDGFLLDTFEVVDVVGLVLLETGTPSFDRGRYIKSVCLVCF